MNIITNIYDSWNSTVYDPRTVEWWPVKHEWIVYVILASYLYFIKQCGPKYMENKRPYNLKTFIKYYNVFQIIYNGWIVYAFIKNGMLTTIGLGCEYIDLSPTGPAMDLVYVFYYTFLLKMIDLIETGIFVLRKKNRQISFLHIYHHISTVYVTHVSIKFYPGGMAAIPALINSSIHVIMYTYYLLSSQGPKVQKIINPFKPYITIMQIVQFFFLLGHSIQGLLPYCHVPKWGVILIFSNLVINFILFVNFYVQNYKKPQKPKKN